MINNILNPQKGSYRKLFIFITIASACYFIYSSVTKDLSVALISLSVFLDALKQVVLPINLDQNICSPKREYISDDDFINHYNSISFSISHSQKNNVFHKFIIWGEKISLYLFIAGVLYGVFI